MRMTLFGTVAAVRARPGCQVELVYSFRQSTGSCAPAQLYRAKAGTCIDRHSSFLCVLNRYGAYACPTHAGSTRVRVWNAILAHARLALKHPPAVIPHTEPPPWTQRYPYQDGFIHPWTPTGSMRRGLKLTGHQKGTCSQTSEETNATTALRCGVRKNGFLYLLDPCFAQSRAWRRGGVIGACENAPGSLTFKRLLITGRAGP
jgi:hypothetical protein